MNLDLSKIYIRRAQPSDAEAIHFAHMKSIQEVCSKDHTALEIQAWGHRPFREDQRLNAIKNDYVWVIEDRGLIKGYGHFKIFEKDGRKNGHILGLYLTPEVVGQSLGRAIIELIKERVEIEGVIEVTLESTLSAHSFYQKMGFKDAGPEKTVEINGTPVRCYPMILKF